MWCGWQLDESHFLYGKGRKDFELIPTIRIERWHSIDGSFSHEFSSIYVVRRLSPDEVGKLFARIAKNGFWEKTTTCTKILKILFQKDSPPRRTTFCVEISWNLAGQKSVKSCVIYLTKKQQKIGPRSRSCFCADRAQNLPGPSPDNILGVPQISSKSVDFRRSYSRTCEHHSNAPQSVSNTRRSFSFFTE